MRIAVLDSDPDQARLVCQVLTTAGHTCQCSASGKEFLERMQRESVDLLVIDNKLSDLSGIEVIRAARGSLPVLFIVGGAAEDEIVAALAAGAGDYLVKPLRRGELALRVRVLLKRAYPEQQATAAIRFGSYAFETDSGRLTVNGKPIDVTRKEFDLALLFFRNLGRPLSRAYIQESIWSRDTDVPSRTMDTHVSRVRNKLGLRPENGFRLVPVYSYGYRLEQLA